MNKKLKQFINKTFSNKLQSELITLRHSIHSEPELSYQEFKTQEKIIKVLSTCNIRQIDTVGTGIIARIKGLDSTLQPVAIRGDMDALPITEDTNLSYQSKTPGVMHACGHDVHSTWAVGAAKLLSENPAPSDVIIILQPAEEVASGAKLLLESGKVPTNISAIFGGHVDRNYPLGKVVVHEGSISSFSDQFTINIHGQSSHAARPEEGESPIPICMECSQAIIKFGESIGDDKKVNIMSITHVSSGSNSHNIIPEKAVIKGTIRCLSLDIRKKFHSQLLSLVKKTNTYQVQLLIEEGSPAVINSTKLTPIVTQTIQTLLNNDAIVPLIKPNLASEDFGHYVQSFPGWFFRFGARYESELFIPVHTPQFYAEDETVFIGSAVLAECARNRYLFP